jgi:hypothetical protein
MNHFTLTLTGLLLSIFTFAQSVQIKKGDNGKFGFVDDDEQWVVPPQFDAIHEFSDTPYTFAKLNGRWGLIDRQGKTILPFEFTRISHLDYGEEVLVSVEKNGRYGLAGMMSGKMIADCVYENPIFFDESFYTDSNILAVVYKNGKAGLLKVNGEEFVPCLYDKSKRPFAVMYSEMHFLVRQNGKAGVIEAANGKLVLPCRFDEVKFSEDSSGDIFQVKKSGKYGIYSITGEEKIAPLYDKPIYFEGDYALVKFKGRFGAINSKGETVVPFVYKKEAEALNKMSDLY